MDDIFKSKCYSIPQFLFAKKYNGLNSTAKLLYAVLFSRLLMNISDDETAVRFRDRGGCFVLVEVSKLTDIFHCGKRAIYENLVKLQLCGLIERKVRDEEIKVYFNI